MVKQFLKRFQGSFVVLITHKFRCTVAMFSFVAVLISSNLCEGATSAIRVVLVRLCTHKALQLYRLTVITTKRKPKQTH